MVSALKEEKNRRIYVVQLKGRLDSFTAIDFEASLEKILERGHIFLMMDAGSLEYISSSGIASLIRLSEKLKEINGAAAFLNPNEEVSLLLEYFHLSTSFPIFEDQEDAKNYLSQKIASHRVPLEILESMQMEPNRSGKISEFDPDRRDGAKMGAVQNGPSLTVTASPVDFLEPDELKSFIKGSIHEMLDREMENRNIKEAQSSGTLIINCERCGEKLRIYRAGMHICPSCYIKFRANSNGTSEFY